jgi:ABC-type multidrug transport system fused ATPase/permease subunit
MHTRQVVFGLLTRREKRSVVFGLLLILFSVFLEIFSIGLIIPILSVVSESSESGDRELILGYFNGVESQTLIIFLMLITSGVFLFKNLLQVFLVWYQQRFTANLDVRLGSELFRIYMGRKYSDCLLLNSSFLIRNVQAVSLISSGYLVPIMNLTSDVVTAGAMFALLFYLEPIGTSSAVLFFGVAGYLFQKSTKGRITRWGEDRLRFEVEALKNLQYGFGGLKDVKVLGREEYFKDSYVKEFSQSMKLERKFNTISATPKGFLEVVSVFGLSLLIISMVLGEKPLNEIVPVIGLFTAAAFRLMPAVTRIISNVGMLRYSSGSIQTFSDDFDIPEVDLNSVDIGELSEQIRFNNVEFTYPNSMKPTLSQLSFSIRKGESVGFIGESGAGKSTLADLLIGLLEPSSGEIYLNEVRVDLTNRSWMNQIGYVPQNIFLTDDSVKMNIAFGIDETNVDCARVDEVVAFSQLREFVDQLPDGIETVVGERGARISGGERQRIGIARALYKRPKILIFDEATSSLDNETEMEIVELIKELGVQCTVISIAHRFSTLKNCNRIFKIENGRIVQEGTFAEVIGT